MLNRPLPYENTTVLVAGTAQVVTVKGERTLGARAIRHLFFCYDDATVTDLRVMIVPRTAPGVMGGAQYHTIRAVATPNTSNRHVLPLGFDLLPGEDVEVTLLSAAGGTIRWRLERVAIRDPKTDVDVEAARA